MTEDTRQYADTVFVPRTLRGRTITCDGCDNVLKRLTDQENNDPHVFDMEWPEPHTVVECLGNIRRSTKAALRASSWELL